MALLEPVKLKLFFPEKSYHSKGFLKANLFDGRRNQEFVPIHYYVCMFSIPSWDFNFIL